jgi:hypothetical protein
VVAFTACTPRRAQGLNRASCLGPHVGYSKRRLRGDFTRVPETSGLYRLYQGERVVYVGQSTNLKARLLAHDMTTSYWGSYDYKSTVGVSAHDRLRMEERVIAATRPTRNRTRPRSLRDE